MYKLGIDLGGTNIAAGIVDEDFKIVATAERKTGADRSNDAIISDIAATALEAVEKAGLKVSDISSAGIGAPGSVDPKNGVIIYSNNISFKNVPIAARLKELTGMDFLLENDANCAAWGEFLAGAGKGAEDFIMITLGTGVGGGIVIGGKLYTGCNYAGGEIGHTVINTDGEACTCGRHGCYEAYASVTALIRQTKQAMIKSKTTLMWELCDGDLDKVTGRTAFDAAKKGDRIADVVVYKYAEYVGVGIANIMNIFQPDIICIGGGISREGERLIGPVRDFVMGENYGRDSQIKCEIKAATLGNDAGIIGAAYICGINEG